MYSGHVAGAVFGRLPKRPTYIILGPNHTGRGAPLAIMSSGEWLTPLGRVPVDSALARLLRRSCHLLMEDAEAHEDEHSLEVQLPFLQRSVGEFKFVPIAIGVGGYSGLESLGHSIAQAVGPTVPVMIIASSDMNHYEPDSLTRQKDRKAIDKILALDPPGLYEVLRHDDISMCGYGPTIAMLTAAKDLGAQRAELVKYATSADTSGDRDAVVGYAGIVVSL
jgi:AmmeMemoRadiSam system protein B